MLDIPEKGLQADIDLVRRGGEPQIQKEREFPRRRPMTIVAVAGSDRRIGGDLTRMRDARLE
jgi:hypothetical protein